MKPIAILETREDSEDRKVREAQGLIDSMFTIYHFHKPDEPEFEPTPKGLSALSKEFSKLGQELSKKTILG